MDIGTQIDWQALHNDDADARLAAFTRMLTRTEKTVDWSYMVWDALLLDLRDGDNHLRSIAAQLLCNLAARSDPEDRMAKAFPALIKGTRDLQLVTARHTLQALWKAGLGGPKQRKRVLDGYAGRFVDCALEKNCTLIRYDIQVALRALFDASQDQGLKDKALALIETETDLKYKKKYTTAWKPEKLAA